jgi:hypothetical protein
MALTQTFKNDNAAKLDKQRPDPVNPASISTAVQEPAIKNAANDSADAEIDEPDTSKPVPVENPDPQVNPDPIDPDITDPVIRDPHDDFYPDDNPDIDPDPYPDFDPDLDTVIENIERKDINEPEPAL